MPSSDEIMRNGVSIGPQSIQKPSVAPIPYTHASKTFQQKSKRAFKVIVIGDSNVGKTCLTFRFCNGRFPEKTEATIGVDFRERLVQIDGEAIRVQLWDTAGQERFRQSMVAHYYRNVNAVVYVYDVTRLQSFKSLTKWINECKINNVDQNVPRILVGNKCDLPKEQVEVNSNEAQKFADSHDMPAFETSAKIDSESDHVESIFMTLIYKLKNSQQMHVSGANITHEDKPLSLSDKLPGRAETTDLSSSCC